jgi:hypothetical protein
MSQWCYIELPEEISTFLKEFVAKIPASWKTDNKGNSSNKEITYKHHITFLQGIQENKHNLELLEKELSTHEPCKLKFGTAFCTKVDRITKRLKIASFY